MEHGVLSNEKREPGRSSVLVVGVSCGRGRHHARCCHTIEVFSHGKHQHRSSTANHNHRDASSTKHGNRDALHPDGGIDNVLHKWHAFAVMITHVPFDASGGRNPTFTHRTPLFARAVRYNLFTHTTPLTCAASAAAACVSSDTCIAVDCTSLSPPCMS